METFLGKGQYSRTVKEIENKISLLKEICQKVGYSYEGKNLSDLLNRLENPFMITVFGEVKAGKSSFLNALLGIENLCKVDIDICTDKITVIKYSPQPYTKELNDWLVEIGVDNPFLKGLVVVDTPGINSVIQHHEEITKNFLPKTDAIIVVISALNPHTRPIWEWVEKIAKDFGKKIIFVLQQKDLLSEEELRKNLRKVEEYARRAGIEDPKIFPVSAKLYFLGKENESNIPLVREFIRKHFTNEEKLKLKLRSVQYELIKEYKKCSQYIDELLKELKQNKEKLQESLSKLNRNLTLIELQKQLILDSLENFLQKLEKETINLLEEKISLIDLLFRKEKIKETVESIAKKVSHELGEYIENSLLPRVQYFEIGILNPAMKEALKNLEDFSELYAKIKGSPLPQIETKDLAKKIEKAVGSLQPPKVEDAITVAGGGLLAGSLMMLLTSATLVDITGGLLSALSLVGGSMVLMKKRKTFLEKIHNLFEREIKENLRREFEKLVSRRVEETIGVLQKLLQDRIILAEGQISQLEQLKEQLNKNLAELEKLVVS